MPFYEYQVIEGHDGCEHCRQGFEKWQKMKDDALTACPECGSPVQRLIFAQSISTPKTPAELKNLGFTKLVKREEGVYENLTRTDKESKYMIRDKPETIPDIKSKISD